MTSKTRKHTCFIVISVQFFWELQYIFIFIIVFIVTFYFYFILLLHPLESYCSLVEIEELQKSG